MSICRLTLFFMFSLVAAKAKHNKSKKRQPKGRSLFISKLVIRQHITYNTPLEHGCSCAEGRSAKDWVQRNVCTCTCGTPAHTQSVKRRRYGRGFESAFGKTNQLGKSPLCGLRSPWSPTTKQPCRTRRMTRTRVITRTTSSASTGMHSLLHRLRRKKRPVGTSRA